MDKAYLIKQLKDLSEASGLSISEEVIAKAIGFSGFKMYSKGEILARNGDKTTTAGLVINGVIRSYYVDKGCNDITQFIATYLGITPESLSRYDLRV